MSAVKELKKWMYLRVLKSTKEKKIKSTKEFTMYGI